MPRPTLQERNRRSHIQRGVRNAKLRATQELMDALGGFLASHRETTPVRDESGECGCELCFVGREAMGKALRAKSGTDAGE